MSTRNIAAVLTPPGMAAIAVIRLSGPAVPAFLAAHFSRPVRPGRCVHGELRDGTRIIDDPLIALLPSGDRADLNVHGGRWVMRATLDLVRRGGFEVIESPGVPVPTELADDAAVLEQEVLAHLPLARTALGVRALLAQPAAWSMLPPHGEDLAALAHGMLQDRTLWLLLHPPRVAIVGAPNVGKSTLANQLFAQERSITADVPGTTRDWVGEIADVDGLPVLLMDTPGLRDAADDPIEQSAIARSRDEIGGAELIVLVLDGSRPLSDGQALAIGAYPGAMRVINKCDRPVAWDIGRATGALKTIARAGVGVAELRRAIVRHFCGAAPVAVDRPRWWTDRQRDWLAALATGRSA